MTGRARGGDRLGVAAGSAIIALMAFGLGGCVRTIGEADLFHPHPGPPPPAAEPIRLERPDGVVLEGRLSAVPDAPVLLYCVGNGETVAAVWPRLQALSARHGLTIAACDYRGYGASTGAPALIACADDALALHDRLRARFPSAPILAYGRSIGTGMACWVAANRPLAGLILEAPPTTAPEVIAAWQRTALPWYARLFVTLRPDAAVAACDRYPLLVAPRITCPTLVLHGDRDRTIPYALGQRTFAALASADKTFITVPGWDHDPVPLEREPAASALAGFVAKTRR